jgi:hypothetical protein
MGHICTNARVNNNNVVLTTVSPEGYPASLAVDFSFVLKDSGPKQPIGPYYTPASAWATLFGASRLLGRVGQFGESMITI